MSNKKKAPWQYDAACRGENPDMFIVEGAAAEAKGEHAKRFCKRCPVVSQCFTLAVETADQYSVMGNTTPKEREQILGHRIVRRRR